MFTFKSLKDYNWMAPTIVGNETALVADWSNFYYNDFSNFYLNGYNSRNFRKRGVMFVHAIGKNARNSNFLAYYSWTATRKSTVASSSR